MAAQEDLDELLATPLGFKPTVQKLRDMIEHIKTNQANIAGNTDEIVDLGGSIPSTWPSNSDTLRAVAETGGNPDVYVCEITGAAGAPPLYNGILLKMYRTGGIVANIGASTLTITNNDDKPYPIKKVFGFGLVELHQADMPTTGALLFFNAEDFVWVLLNPTSANSKHTVVNELGDPANYTEGEFVYVIE